MKFRSFGATAFKTSEIGFGAWAIGGEGYGVTDDRQSLAALETAHDLGVNFFDTADTYGNGHSESLIKQFLKGKNRESIFIASKVGWNFYEKPTKKCFDEAYIRKACENSLQRLGVEAIDLYQLHNPSLQQLIDLNPGGCLSRLKKEGKIRFAGISVHREEEALQALECNEIDAVQLILNMLDQRMLDRVIQKAVTKRVALVAREPLASGLLSGKYNHLNDFEKGDHRRRWSLDKREADLEKMKLIREVLQNDDVNLVHHAIEFVLSVPEVSVVIPGIKTKQQAIENLKPSVEKKMTLQQIEKIKEIFKNEPIFKTALNPS